MDIDAVEQGTADLAEIVLDLAGGAAALAGGIAVEPALTGVQITTAPDMKLECRAKRDVQDLPGYWHLAAAVDGTE